MSDSRTVYDRWQYRIWNIQQQHLVRLLLLAQHAVKSSFSGLLPWPSSCHFDSRLAMVIGRKQRESRDGAAWIKRASSFEFEIFTPSFVWCRRNKNTFIYSGHWWGKGGRVYRATGSAWIWIGGPVVNGAGSITGAITLFFPSAPTLGRFWIHFVFSFERRRALVDGQKRDAVAWRLSFSYVNGDNGDNGLNKWKDSHPVFSLLPPIVLYLFYVKGKDSKPSIMDGIEPLAAPPTHLGEYTNWFPCAVACDTDQSVGFFVFFVSHVRESLIGSELRPISFLMAGTHRRVRVETRCKELWREEL